MHPLPLNTLLSAVGGEAIGFGRGQVMIERITTDSRSVAPGDLFWALRGERLDGHDFIDQALRSGAAGAVVTRAWREQHRRTASRCIVVDDTLQALWNLAAWHRSRTDALVVGVTGSVGKTTTRQMLHGVLAAKHRGVQSPYNFNNRFGVPLSLLELSPEDEFAVLEAGASHVGEIGQLAQLMQPEVGVITAIAPAHLEGFGSLEDICRAKGELLEALPSTGFAVLNGDDPLVRRLGRRASCRVILVGESIHNDLVASRVRVNDRRLRFRVGDAEFQVPAVGRHHLTAALLSLAVAREIDLSDAEIAAGLRDFQPAPGRCQKLAIGPWTVIDDTYNANPGSVLAACAALRDWESGRQKILVLGDMLELGPHARTFHEQIGEVAAELQFDRVIAVGSQAAAVAGTAKQHGMDAGCLGACGDLDTALLLLDLWLEPGDVVLVKGSRGMRMERVIDHLQARGAAASPDNLAEERRAA